MHADRLCAGLHEGTVALEEEIRQRDRDKTSVPNDDYSPFALNAQTGTPQT